MSARVRVCYPAHGAARLLGVLAWACLVDQARPEQPGRPHLQRPTSSFSAPARGSSGAHRLQLKIGELPQVPSQGKQPMEPGVGFDAMRGLRMPALMCQRVTGIDGKWGLLCKPLPPSNTTGMNETQVAASQRIARQLAEQARQLNSPAKGALVMHREPAVYHWEDSSTFTYIQHKKHFYNVHYADSSALKIETGLDVCALGPFRFYTRFGLITEAVSGRPGADLQGADGILGFGYTDLPRSASLMKTLTRHSRPNWKLTQPDSMRLMKNNSFTVLSSITQGELHLGGYDPAAADGEVMWVPMVNLTGYGVNITSIMYGGKELLELGSRGLLAGGTMGVFDTGSTCLNLPRGLFNNYYKSSLFDNFAALASTNPTLPIVITLNGRVRLEIPQSSWSEPWACTYPFTQSNVVLFGHHVFRAYMVVHDMNPPHYHMGFAKISPSYVFSSTPHTVTVPLADQRPYVTALRPSEVSEVAKVPLILEARVHLFVSLSLGSPPQTFLCVFDTGSVLLAVFSGNVSTDLAAQKTKRVMHVQEPAVLI